MLRKLYNLVKKLFMLLFLSRQPGLLEVLVRNITAVYHSPEKFTSQELFNITKLYLSELKTLENELQNNSSYILEIGNILNDKSIPKHLNQVPISTLKKVYNWGENELDSYMVAMCQTNRIWYNIVQFLKDHNCSLVQKFVI